jgi:N utilization substance protein A
VPNERYYIRQKLRVLVLEVNKTSRGPEIIASRSHPDMLRRLLEVEVPEIYNGLVEIKAIAREAGSRAKVAVSALQQGIDPVGACVGMRGVRIQSIVSELNGEKIDVIGWSADPKEFISKSLSPARPVGVELALDEDVGRTAMVIVPDRELSLAIGREGQNARLAAKLTGWRIDIVGATEAAEIAVRRAEEEAARAAARAEISEDMSLEKLGMSKRIVNALGSAGIAELGQLLDVMDEQGEGAFLELKGFGEKSLQDLQRIIEEREVRDVLGRELIEEVAEEEPEPIHEMETEDATEEEAVPDEEEVEEVTLLDVTEETPSPPEVPEEVAEPIPAEDVAEAVEDAEVSEEVGEPVQEEPTERDEPKEPPALEDILLQDDKQAGKKKRPTKRLVYDESTGEVIARKVRKPGRRREDWEDSVS